jgi:uncharacterized protein (DUF433 family)
MEQHTRIVELSARGWAPSTIADHLRLTLTDVLDVLREERDHEPPA